MIAEMTSNGAEMSAGAHQHARTDLSVDDPLIGFAVDAADGEVLAQSRAGASQQVIVKLTASDAVADDLTAIDGDLFLPECTGAESGDGLESARARVVLQVEIEF